MNIPKLAKGGIIEKNSLFFANEKGKSWLEKQDKYYQIYLRTKKSRIKKKQDKKSPILKCRNEFKQLMKLPRLSLNDVNIYINGKKVNKENFSLEE